MNELDKACSENPDLPKKYIEEALKAKQLIDNGEGIKYERRRRNFKYNSSKTLTKPMKGLDLDIFAYKVSANFARSLVWGEQVGDVTKLRFIDLSLIKIGELKVLSLTLGPFNLTIGK